MEASNPSPRWGRIHPLLGFALSAGMLLAACGGAAAPTSSAAPASSSAPSSSAAASSAPASAASSAAASSSASASASSSGAATGTPIKIGVLDDLTGGGSIEGAEQKINVDLAVAQINAAGGINGHPLATTIVDSKGDAATAAQMATQLAQQDKVDVLVGGVYSAECLGVQKEISTLGI
ncbi:MAG TPA: ABC transporter substrate-binding protein, partial [Chloroflexota bacterium]|nr:ABC transporter substrate-binding protein [Chloroflexota bacterium]